MRSNGVEQQGHALQWSLLPGGAFQICGRSLPRLPEGAFDCEADMDGQIRFTPRNLKVDELIDCSASLAARLLHDELAGEIGPPADRATSAIRPSPVHQLP